MMCLLAPFQAWALIYTVWYMPAHQSGSHRRKVVRTVSNGFCRSHVLGWCCFNRLCSSFTKPRKRKPAWPARQSFPPPRFGWVVGWVGLVCVAMMTLHQHACRQGVQLHERFCDYFCIRLLLTLRPPHSFHSRDIASAGCRLPAAHQEGWVVMGVDVVALSSAIHAKVSIV